MKRINHSQLEDLIEIRYKSVNPITQKKTCLLVYGTYGIGKSYVIKKKAEALAKEKGKIFVNWNELPENYKIEVYNNANKYFVFLDIRLSEFDASDIKGLPIESKEQRMTEWLHWKVSFFAKLLENPKADGVLLFDELNLATPLVISSCYKILYDRIINDGKVADDWLIIGCGNLATDKAYTHDLASPVRDRGTEAELMSASGEDWVKDFAIPNGFESEITAFILTKPSSLHDTNSDDSEQKATTERGWERVDSDIKYLKSIGDFNHKSLELIATTNIGEGVGREFVAYWKVSQSINIEEIIKNPKKIEEVGEVDLKYFVIVSLAERFGNKKVKFDKIMEMSEVLDKIGCAELVALLWRLAYKHNTKDFKNDFIKSKSELKEKYSNYLKDDD